MLARLVLAAWSVFLAAHAAAEPAPPDSLVRYVLEPIPVEAEAWRSLNADLPVASSTLRGTDLNRCGVLRVADALAWVPGLRVARFGAPGSFASLSIRGVSNEQVLVLVDGRRLTPAQGGGVDLGAIDVAALDRVEVVRGGASALYGSDALGGVVNLVTRPTGAARNATTFRLEAGSFGTRAATVAHEQRAGPGGRFWLSASGLTTAGDYRLTTRGQEVSRQNAEVEALGAALGFKMRSDSGLGITLDGALDSGEQGVPGTVEFPTPAAQRGDRRMRVATELAFGGTAGEPGSRFTLAVNGHRERRSYSDPGLAIADRHVNRALGLDLRLDRVAAASLLSAGMEWRRATLESTVDGARERRTAAGYVRWRWGRGRFEVAPAVRLDVESGLEAVVSPRLAVAVHLPRALELRAAAGRAYRPPSFDDLFAADRGASLINPDLDPELATELEVGLERGFAGPRGGGARLAVSAFHREIAQLIQWTAGPDGRYRPHNIGLAVVQGLEIEGSTAVSFAGLPRPGELEAAVTFLDARNRTGDAQVGGRRLPYRALVEGHVEIAVPVSSGLDLRAAWHGVGKSYVTAANTKSLPGYGLVDLSAEQQLGPRLKASLAVRNVGGVAAVDVRDYPLPGREWRLALRLATLETR